MRQGLRRVVARSSKSALFEYRTIVRIEGKCNSGVSIADSRQTWVLPAWPPCCDLNLTLERSKVGPCALSMCVTVMESVRGKGDATLRHGPPVTGCLRIGEHRKVHRALDCEPCPCHDPNSLTNVRPEGLEPPTDRVETGCSIH
jgi:hypothetical protein